MGKNTTEGLDAGYAKQLQALIAATGGRVYIKSGFRSVQRQQQLWDAAVRKYGSAKAARKWVAPPGKSNHNHGFAADLGGDLELAARLAPRFGITRPMAHEPWHFEPVGRRAKSSPQAYTEPGDQNVNVDKFMGALIGQESGGSATVTNSRTGAIGLGQILPSNYAPWAKAAGVNPSDKSPAAQQKIIRHKLNEYYNAFGNWRDVAIAWYAGPGAVKGKRNRDKKQGKGNEPSINEYADSVMRRLGAGGGQAMAGGQEGGHAGHSDEPDHTQNNFSVRGQLDNLLSLLGGGEHDPTIADPDDDDAGGPAVDVLEPGAVGAATDPLTTSKQLLKGGMV